MENQNYTATIEVKAPVEKTFKSINNVSEWWNENLEGSSLAAVGGTPTEYLSH